MNRDRFRFSQASIVVDYNDVLISSNNRVEMLYLFALLNANISYKIFDLFLFLENEQDLTIGIKSIKQYIRIPRITSKNQKLKDRIIALTESMLALEDVTLQDVVDFGKLNVQKFDGIHVAKNELVLSNGREFRLQIASGKSALVEKIIHEKYPDADLLKGQPIPLAELKSLSAIDFAERDAIKQEIDDLVFALYFDVPVKDVPKHEFYGYVNA
jgi:hypothetical protein